VKLSPSLTVIVLPEGVCVNLRTALRHALKSIYRSLISSFDRETAPVPQQQYTAQLCVCDDAVADEDLLQLFERNLLGDETELSLRQIGRTLDKLVLQLGTTPQPQPQKPKFKVV
jgi:hypothetical protein